MRGAEGHPEVMTLPQAQPHRMRLRARDRVPEQLEDALKVEADVARAWDGACEHTRFPTGGCAIRSRAAKERATGAIAT